MKSVRPKILAGAGPGKRWLGIAMLVMSLMVNTGVDKRLEAWAVGWIPDWATSL